MSSKSWHKSTRATKNITAMGLEALHATEREYELGRENPEYHRDALKFWMG